jgi:hypothetical protein
MDGMHRVVRALLEGRSTIAAVRFEVQPEPDYRNCDPATLPYPDDPSSENGTASASGPTGGAIGADRSSLDSDQLVEYTLLWTEAVSRRPGFGR